MGEGRHRGLKMKNPREEKSGRVDVGVGGEKGDELQTLSTVDGLSPLLPRISLPGCLFVVFVFLYVEFVLVVVVFS